MSAVPNPYAAQLSRKVAGLFSAPVTIADERDIVIAWSDPLIVPNAEMICDPRASRDLQVMMQVGGRAAKVFGGSPATGDVLSPGLVQAALDLLSDGPALIEKFRREHAVKDRFIDDLLTHAHHDFWLPVREDRTEGYYGKTPGYPWPPNVYQVPVDDVRNTCFDVVLFQSRHNHVRVQFDIRSPEQQRLPRIYHEHDPPREHPTDTCHIVDDPDILLVHVTHFNTLMWNCGNTSTRVIEHGAVVPERIRYSRELERGIVVVNNSRKRGHHLGLEVYATVENTVPLPRLRHHTLRFLLS